MHNLSLHFRYVLDRLIYTYAIVRYVSLVAQAFVYLIVASAIKRHCQSQIVYQEVLAILNSVPVSYFRLCSTSAFCSDVYVGRIDCV